MIDQAVIQELISEVELFIYISGPKMFVLTGCSTCLSTYIFPYAYAYFLCRVVDNHRVPQTKSYKPFIVPQEYLGGNLIITVIIRWQPVTYYSELFMSSDLDLCVSLATLSTAK